MQRKDLSEKRVVRFYLSFGCLFWGIGAMGYFMVFPPQMNLKLPFRLLVAPFQAVPRRKEDEPAATFADSRPGTQ